MKVVLLQDVPKLGKKFDIKNVSDGHALNLLIPKGLVKEATAGVVKSAEAEKNRLDAERKIHEDLLFKNLKSLEGAKVEITEKANAKGHLFAGVHKDALVKLLKEQTHIEVHPDFVKLDHPLKEVGEHIVPVEAGGKKGSFKVVINSL